MEKAIKIVLAILFFICIADMPYGYYQLVRFAACAGFAFLAVQANRNGRQTEMVLYVLLALLFQPFLKVALGRTLWNIVDALVGAGLLLSVWLMPDKKKEG